MYKRKASVSGGLGGFLERRRTYKRAKAPSKGPYANRAPYQSPAARSMSTKLKHLMAGRTKDAVDIAHNVTVAPTDAAQYCCLTASGTGFPEVATAGILYADTDQVTINKLTIRGSLKLVVSTDASPAALAATRLRRILVWFKKSKTDPSSGGALPPITEVLVTDHIDSLYVAEAQNVGRHLILQDKTWALGMALQTTTGGVDLMAQGSLVQSLDEEIKIGKVLKFEGDPANTLAGHYDTDGNYQQLVSEGLFVMYLVADDESANNVQVIMNCRLNYTA